MMMTIDDKVGVRRHRRWFSFRANEAVMLVLKKKYKFFFFEKTQSRLMTARQ